MELVTTLSLVTGLASLVVGAELLVRGAARLAVLAAISPLIIGLTVVAFATSAPELAVSVRAALGGRADLALGNVVGSNIFNVLVILGLSGLLVPLSVQVRLVRLDVPLMIAASVTLVVLGMDGKVGRMEGALLVVAGLAYTAFLIRQARREGAVAVEVPEGEGSGGLPASLLQVAAGLGLLVLGSRWLVIGAVAVARALGVSELLVGLTVVAAGTSLPEAATSVMAALRGQRDIAVGNVVGSNLFNILWVLGLSATVAPSGVAVAAPAQALDLPVMVATAVACLPIFFTGYEISRWEGGLLLLGYGAYTAYLVLVATGHATLATGHQILLVLVPVAAAVLSLELVRHWRAGPGR